MREYLLKQPLGCLNNLSSYTFPINNGARQGHPILPKLFTSEEIFKEAQVRIWTKQGWRYFPDLRFGNDVALQTESTRETEQHVNRLDVISETEGLEMHEAKTVNVTNFDNQSEIIMG